VLLRCLLSGGTAKKARELLWRVQRKMAGVRSYLFRKGTSDLTRPEMGALNIVLQ